MPLSDTTIALVKATVPALESHGLAITRRMYERMFRNEAIRDLFNQSHHGETGSQPKALAAAVWPMRGISTGSPVSVRRGRAHRPEACRPADPARALPACGGGSARGHQRRARRCGDSRDHRRLGEGLLVPGRYPDGPEAQIYLAMAEARGGWKGWRHFVVAERTGRADHYLLHPAAGGWRAGDAPPARPVPDLPAADPGPATAEAQLQHLLRPRCTGLPHLGQAGAAGRRLQLAARHAGPGTVLKVAAPAGEFFLPERPERPVALLSAAASA